LRDGYDLISTYQRLTVAHLVECVPEVVAYLVKCEQVFVAHLVKCVQAVVEPFKVFGGTRRVWYKVLVAWLVAAVLAIPKPLSFVQTEHQQQVRRSSSEDHAQTVTVYRCETCTPVLHTDCHRVQVRDVYTCTSTTYTDCHRVQM